MSKNIVLFVSGFLGEEVLRVLSKTRCRPFVAVYHTGAKRRKAEFDFSQFTNIFQIFTVTNDKFDQIPCDKKFPQFDYAIGIDWTKDFFSEVADDSDFKIYHAHPSLLPLYRGYGAVSEQFLRGVCISGISLYEDNGIIDGGEIVFSEKIRIELEDTPEFFLKNCALILADFIIRLEKGEEFPKSFQDPSKSFYVARTRNNQKFVDFNASAYCVHNFIRAYSFPYPGARFHYKGEEYKAFSSMVESWSGLQGDAGQVLRVTADGVEVACGEGSVLIKSISFNEAVIEIGDFGFDVGGFLI